MIGRGRGRYRAAAFLARVMPDVLAPSVPQNLAAARDTPTQITLTWDASTDSGGGVVSYYIVWQDDVDVAHVNHPTVTKVVTGLTQNTSYTFKVSAVDNLGNQSAKSAGVTTKPWTPYVDLDNQFLILDTVTGHYTTASGGVDQWTDQTANVYHALQGTAANRPDIVANDPTPYDSVNFVAANADRLVFTGKGAAMFAGLTNKFSLSFWMKCDTSSTKRIIETGETAGTSKFILISRNGGGNTFSVYISSDGTALIQRDVSFSSWTAWNHFLILYDGTQAVAADRLVVKIGGAAQSQSGAGTLPASLYTGGSQDWQISGVPGGGTSVLNGNMDNIVWTSDVFTASEQTNLGLWRAHA